MKDRMVDDSVLFEKSAELEIPYSKLLAGWILEEVIRRVFESSFGEYLWFEDGQKLGVEQYHKIQDLILHFQYCPSAKKMDASQMIAGQKLSRLLGLVMIATIFHSDEKSNIIWKGNAVEKNGKVELNLYAEFEEKEIPVYLIIQTVEHQNLIPKKNEFTPFTNTNKQISYFEYPVEMRLAEHLFEIMEKMELIPSMKSFDIVYRILTEQIMNVRHVRDLLEELCKEKPVVKNESRLETIEGYVGYGYMKKKWERYLHHQRKPETAWEEVMQVFLTFMKPVWHAVCTDEIFFDDWMPALRRFLG